MNLFADLLAGSSSARDARRGEVLGLAAQAGAARPPEGVVTQTGQYRVYRCLVDEARGAHIV